MEIWKDILSLEGYYQISNEGRVRGVDRTRKLKVFKNGSTKEFIWGTAPVKGRIIKPFYDDRKRPRVCLLKKHYFISILVAKHFIEIKESDNKNCVVNHLDNDPSNNRVENLEWVTQKENIQHSIRQKRHSSVTRWQ